MPWTPPPPPLDEQNRLALDSKIYESLSGGEGMNQKVVALNKIIACSSDKDDCLAIALFTISFSSLHYNVI